MSFKSKKLNNKPSVIQTIKSISAYTASSMALAANGGGT